MNLNKVILAGNLTRDPELRSVTTLADGEEVSVCEFGIAVNGRRNSDEADFFSVTCWRGVADSVAEYKQKGDPVLVEGSLKYDSWQADDGSKRSRVTVTAQNVIFLPGGARQDDDGDEDFEDFDDEPRQASARTRRRPPRKSRTAA